MHTAKPPAIAFPAGGNYFFPPDVIAEICRELGVPFRTNGYRYWKATR